MGRKVKNLRGKKFGELTALEIIGRDKHGRLLWFCQCNCGRTIAVPTGSLTQGNTKSCGCLKRGKQGIKLPKGESGLKCLFNSYRSKARKRKLKWELTKNEFRQLTKGTCHYCGVEPYQVINSQSEHGAYTYNGIDRIDNTKGYCPDNVVPCCGYCNKAKGTLTYDDFINYIKDLSAHLPTLLKK